MIKKWLKAGVLDTDGKVLRPEGGTPQGGVISPLLANVYLHYALDLWFERVFQRSCKGGAAGEGTVSAVEREAPRLLLFGDRARLSLRAAASIHEEPGAGKLHAGICAGAVG